MVIKFDSVFKKNSFTSIAPIFNPWTSISPTFKSGIYEKKSKLKAPTFNCLNLRVMHINCQDLQVGEVKRNYLLPKLV